MPKIIVEPKKLIHQAARSLIKEKGLDGLNMREIAKTCSLGVGTLYHYYPNKLALIFDLMEEDWKRKKEEILAKIEKASTLRDDVLLLYSGIQEFQNENRTLFHGYPIDDFPSFFTKLHPLFLDSVLDILSTIEKKENLTLSKETKVLIAELIIASCRSNVISFTTLMDGISKLVS